MTGKLNKKQQIIENVRIEFEFLITQEFKFLKWLYG